ncbi:hypothetical protein FQ087_13155 [Sporosarcina sp. ANT_H38]|uniref:hypothetical protein n=1 Tax=Sporosarcina sp. ANT_H38 TaxID=2597358 RepID=UPI0011F29BEA|nr:hypothetical protein [Sporosarcina sp. ANT_H38]KAA0955552.1 hypothetical protein FQ087_13155 [Sporosarcina sp. ANT_H38]
MLNKLKNYKKVTILLGAFLISIGLGSGMNMAFAGQSIESSFANWFGAKKTASEQEIAAAITAEKDRLMDDLKVALQEEMESAKKELEAFTIDEQNRRTLALQEYAANLKADMKTDLTEEKQAIIADLDAKYEKAVEELNKPSTPIELVPPQQPEVEGKPETTPEPGTELTPDLKPEGEKGEDSALKPETGTNPEPTPTPEPDAGTKPNPAPEPESATKPDPAPTPEVEPTPEPTPEPTVESESAQ